MIPMLYWKPAVEQKIADLPFDLKQVIAKRFWGQDGSLRGAAMLFGPTNIPYFSGLADAGINGADKVVELLEKHGEIYLYIE